jgi:DNA-binding transcriptional ArsR family regulator
MVRYMVNKTAVGDLLDRVFMALSDGSRRHIVTQLAERGALSVGEASEALDLSPAGVTKHVRVLEDAGLVSRRLAGRRHVLSLESAHLLLAEDWIERYLTIWTDSLERLATLAAELEQEQTP